MLKSIPLSPSAECRIQWAELKPMTVDLFNKYWQHVEENAPMLDLVNASYEEWQNEHDWKIFGMRENDTGKKHGVCRVILPTGEIHQMTYKHGALHGLFVRIYASSVYAMIFDNNLCIANPEL